MLSQNASHHVRNLNTLKMPSEEGSPSWPCWVTHGKKYSTSSTSSSHWKSGTQTHSGRRLSNTLVSAFIWLQPQGRTINLSCNPNKIIFTHCCKPIGFGGICSAATDKQNTFFYLKAKEEKLGHRSAFFTLLCTSLLFFLHL